MPKTSFITQELERAEQQLKRLKALQTTMQGIYATVAGAANSPVSYREEYVEQIRKECIDLNAATMYAALVVSALKGEPQGDHPAR